MSVVAMILGSGLILLTLRDIILTLFRPTGTGTMAQVLMRTVWRMFRWSAMRFPSMLLLAGPSMLVLIAFSWVILLILGWALIFWPHIPGAFTYGVGVDTVPSGSLIDALYLSVVTLATLGYGDITPDSSWLRLLSPLESLVGFALLSSATTWILTIMPAVTRRRTLAHQVSTIYSAEMSVGLDLEQMPSETSEHLLSDLARQLIAVQVDLLQVDISYYFEPRDSRLVLATAMPYLVSLADRGSDPQCEPGVRLQAAILRRSIDDLAAVIGANFLNLSSAPTDEVLRAYARDHLRDLSNNSAYQGDG